MKARITVNVVSVIFLLAACSNIPSSPVASTQPFAPMFDTSVHLTATPNRNGTPLPLLTSSRFTTPPVPMTSLSDITTPRAQKTWITNRPYLTRVADMQFLDSVQGWLLGVSYQMDNQEFGIAIRYTVDGGTTWTTIPVPDVLPSFYPPEYGSSNPYKVSHIRFVDEHTGWIFGPAMYYTQDGGEEWHLVEFPGAVVALEPAGVDKPVWAIVQVCQQIVECTAQLYEATPDEPNQWTVISYIPSQHPVLAFLRPNINDGYILSNVGTSNNGDIYDFHLTISATHDEGQTWGTLTTDCLTQDPLLASPDSTFLFLVCSGMPGAGAQLKQLYISTDRGATWSIVKDTSGQTIFSGHGYSNALVFISNTDGFLALGRSTVLITRDGGISWSGSGLHNIADSSWVMVKAGEKGIFAAVSTTIYHSSDGGLTWQSSEIQ